MPNQKQIYLVSTIVALTAACVLLALLLGREVMNLKFYADAAARKQNEMDVKDLKYNKDMESMNRILSDLNGRFRLVSEVEAESVENIVQQIPAEEDKILVSKYSNSADSSLNALKKSLSNYLHREGRITALTADPDGMKFSDRNAALLEGIAANAGFKSKTELFWDRKSLRRWTETELTAPDGTKSRIQLGKSAAAADTLRQKGGETLVFPFRVDLMSGRPQTICRSGAELPAGQLYVHYYHGFSKGNWKLVYEFAKGTEPEVCNLRAVGLLPGNRIESIVVGNKQTFQIAAPFQESAVLVFADKLFLPESVTAELSTERTASAR